MSLSYEYLEPDTYFVPNTFSELWMCYKIRPILNVNTPIVLIYEGRLQNSWTHLIIPSRNSVEVRWRSLLEVPLLASDALLTTLHPLLENVLQTVDHLEISCFGAPFSWLEKPRNQSHGARSELYGGCSSGVPPIQFLPAEHRIQFRSRPVRSLVSFAAITLRVASQRVFVVVVVVYFVIDSVRKLLDTRSQCSMRFVSRYTSKFRDLVMSTGTFPACCSW
jgi:hypothetical protein